MLGWEYRGLAQGCLEQGRTRALKGAGWLGEAGVCLLLPWGQEPRASKEREELNHSSLGMAWELVGS